METGNRAVEAIASLHGRGARFVLLRGGDKVPVKGGWADGKPTSISEAWKHVERGGALGVVPWSLNCAVVDIDGGKRSDGSTPAPGELAELADEIIDWIGADPVAVMHSASGARTGKRHIWFRFSGTTEAPLGYLASGSPRKLSGGLRWNGPGTSFDTRCITGYVRVDTYLEELAEALGIADGEPPQDLSKLAEIDDRCRGRKAAPARPAPVQGTLLRARSRAKTFFPKGSIQQAYYEALRGRGSTHGEAAGSISALAAQAA